MKGILVLNHGSRGVRAQQGFKSLLEKLQLMIDWKVEGANLSAASPNFLQAVDKLVKQGVTGILVIPLFFFPGIHVEKDVPALVSKAREEYPEISIMLDEVIGDDDLLVRLLMERIGRWQEGNGRNDQH